MTVNHTGNLRARAKHLLDNRTDAACAREIKLALSQEARGIHYSKHTLASELRSEAARRRIKL